MVAQSLVTLPISSKEGLGALADAWQYQHLRTAYDPRRSMSPVDGLMHAPTSAAAFSDCRWESSRRDLWTDFLRALATIQKWWGLLRRLERLSIRLMVDDDIHKERGGSVKWGGGDGIKGVKGLERCVCHAEV